MKRITLVIFVFVSLFPTQVFSAKEILPPGCVKVNDSLFVDATEMRNVDYAEFVYWNLYKTGAESEEYLSSLPDTAVWSSPLLELYYQHPAYSNYPVVGISYEQAIAYCEWRSDRVNEMLYLKENKIPYSDIDKVKDIPQVFRYRLPTKQEWEQIAAISYSEKTFKKISSKKNKDLFRYNFVNGRGDITQMSDNADITAQVFSYWPNALGVYNILGNVAEMTIEKGLAKGGSWIDKSEEVQVETDFTYEKPEQWIGFRCVCEKI